MHTQTVANGPTSAKFAPPWLKPPVTPLARNLFLSNTRQSRRWHYTI